MTKRKMDVHHSSKSAEHYTPSHVIELARRVMGSIDLDPASCDEANEAVSATRYYTKADDGLSLPWHGNVWLNPPYGRAVWNFTEKLRREYHAGHAQQAIALLPARTDTQWFLPLYEFPLCFWTGRLTFAGNKDPAPFPSALVYMGKHIDRFVQEFSPYGRIMVAYQLPDTQCKVCQRGFTAKRADALYCSPACKQKAIRTRRIRL